MTYTFALTGEMGFEPCYAEVLRVVQGRLHQPEEIRGSSFYAFSYYYDRAADTHLIGEFIAWGQATQEERGTMLRKVKSVKGCVGWSDCQLFQ